MGSSGSGDAISDAGGDFGMNEEESKEEEEEEEEEEDQERSRVSHRGTFSRSNDAASEWAVLNRNLAEAGLPGIELRPVAGAVGGDQSDPEGDPDGGQEGGGGWHNTVSVGGLRWVVDPGSVRQALAEALKQYARRGQRLSELHARPGGPAGLASPMPTAAPLGAAHAPFGSASSHGMHGRQGRRSGHGGPGGAAGSSDNDDASLDQAAAGEARLVRAVRRLELQLGEADAEAASLRRLGAESERQHASRLKELKLQVRQSEHRVRAQEAAQERLADKLRVQVRWGVLGGVHPTARSGRGVKV